jgi:acyl-CoA thioesterase
MDDIQPQSVKSISDDQELAEVLSGISRDKDGAINYEETPSSMPPLPQLPETPEMPEMPEEMPPKLDGSNDQDKPAQTETTHNELESIKKTALQELRPLVDKLDLSPEEKFDIYLLLLRSTDDTTLIAPAHSTAQQIEDESKRAQALLDIIKEIDFLAKPI